MQPGPRHLAGPHMCSHVQPMGLCSALGFGSFIQEQIFLRTCPVPGPEEKLNKRGPQALLLWSLECRKAGTINPSLTYALKDGEVGGVEVLDTRMWGRRLRR